MATVTETMMQDAAASIDTAYVISAGDMFTGNLSTKHDEDWIRIELKAGMTYSITLTGAATNGVSDPILMLLDSKGGLIAMNDDINPAGSARPGDATNLNSALRFRAEEDGDYYISASSYTGNPGVDSKGAYTISVMELDLPADIMGTTAADKIKGTDAGETIEGGDGADTIDGMGGDDEINGGKGNDLITGGAGADMINGGADNDTVSYMYSPAGVSINLRSGAAAGGDAAGDKLGTDIENVRGSMYDDELMGTRGENMLWGLDGDDSLSGDRSADMLYGGGGNDMLDGGDGDDTLSGGAGMDELTGGSGMDTASYMGSMMGVTVRLHSGQAMDGDAEGDTWGSMTTVPYRLPDKDDPTKMVDYTESVPDIENLTGSNMGDILAGDSRGNTIKGMGGDDKLYGGPGGGADSLYGGDGDDSLFGGRDVDMLDGGAGDDTLHGGHGNDMIYGGPGSDMIYAEQGDSVNGWVKDQDPADDNQSTRDGPLGEDMKDPGAKDTVSYERLKAGVDVTINTTTLANVENLIGTDENDKLTGDGSNNEIDGRDGADELDGGDGNDTVSYAMSDRRVSVTVDADGETLPSGGHAQGDKVENFENATGSAYGDRLTGDEGANVLTGLAGDDDLDGKQGSDTLVGGAGADEMNGGTNDNDNTNDNGADTDNDTVSYAGSDAGVSVSLAAITFSGGHAEGDEDNGTGRDAYDPDGTGPMDPVDVSSFESVTGSDHNDSLTGDHRTNTLTGGKGDDSLRGMAGADTLIGGPGADMLDGGKSLSAGADTPNDNTDDVQHIDVASYDGAKAGVTVNLASGRGTGGDAEGDTLVNIEQVKGSGHDDTFLAGPGKDHVDGGGNTDGGMGDTVSYELSPEGVILTLPDPGTELASITADVKDTTPFAEDQDSYAIGDKLKDIENVIGTDYKDAITGNSAGNWLVGGGGDDTLTGAGGKDTLEGGAGKDTLSGGGEADKLMGGAGVDTIDGGDGADTINGGTGGDNLTGGGAGDTFVFGPDSVTANDIISDFNKGDGDKIDLRAFGIDESDLPGLVEARGGVVRINLNAYGGGTIELTGVTDVDQLDGTNNASDNNMLDGDFTGSDGAFIL